MDPTPPQDEFELPESGAETPLSSSPLADLQKHVRGLQARLEDQERRGRAEVAELSEQCDFLATLLTGTLVATLICAIAVDFFLFKQMQDARSALVIQRPMLTASLHEFDTQVDPKIRTFIAQLQNFAAAHPGFRPLLEKYRQRLPQYYTSVVPALPPVQPVPTNAPAPADP